jgi:hypothetical protein
MTTAVTDLSEQKKVLERRAYCSENFLIISTDLSASPPAARPRKIAFSVRLGRGEEDDSDWDWGFGSFTVRTLSPNDASPPAAPGDGRRAERAAGGGGGDGHHRRSGSGLWPWGGRGGKKEGERDKRRAGWTHRHRPALPHTHTLELWKDRSPSRHMFQFHFNFGLPFDLLLFLLANYICFLIAGSNSIITYTYMLLISQNQINLPEKY